MATFDGRVQGDNDNAKAKTGSYDHVNPLIFGRDGKNAENDTRVYGRWQPQIPSGAIVTSAYLYVVSQTDNSDAFYTEVDLITQNGRDCPAFTSNPWAWTLLGSVVRWPPSGNLPAWSLDIEYQSPEIKSLIQNWIDNVSDPETCWLGLVILDGDAANDETREVYSYSGAAAKALRLVINYVTLVETITAKQFPMYYLEKPPKAEELISKVEGATVTHVAKDFPEKLLKEGKAKELRSKFQ